MVITKSSTRKATSALVPENGRNDHSRK
jgi:hypothetical protein